jgi:CDGSH-type Zn-finger protein
MTEPNNAANSPIAVQLEKGKTYAWCSCHKSAKQPFCDGSHRGTGYQPKVFVAKEDGEAWLCGCKQTKDAPFCDGTHKSVG